MKQYVVDELRPGDYNKIKCYLDKTLSAGSIEGIYWVPIKAKLLTGEQAGHTECQPLCFAIDLEPNRLICELLLRTKSRIRCSCIGYATEAQRNWVIRFIDGMLDALNITT